MSLQLAVHLEHSAGELAFVAPPLPKDEILSGVAGFLESSDIYRARPCASDLYMHSPSDSSSDNDMGSDVSIVSGSGVSNYGPSHRHGHGHGDGHTVKQRRPFEVSKLPTINDPRGTEKLIEALFNPVPVTQPSKVTPFTYLVEVEGDGDGDGEGENASYRAATPAGHEGKRSRRGGIEADDDGSLYNESQDESEGEADGVKSDYHSLRSHPSVQDSLRSKHSTRSLTGKVGLKRDDGKETALSTAIQGGTTERRTWWQKVLSAPSSSG